MSGWRESIYAVDRRFLAPDPDVLGAIGLSHKMTSAIADLVDNSIDAKAGGGGTFGSASWRTTGGSPRSSGGTTASGWTIVGSTKR